jgi:hypothetical protein
LILGQEEEELLLGGRQVDPLSGALHFQPPSVDHQTAIRV